MPTKSVLNVAFMPAVKNMALLQIFEAMRHKFSKERYKSYVRSSSPLYNINMFAKTICNRWMLSECKTQRTHVEIAYSSTRYSFLILFRNIRYSLFDVHMLFLAQWTEWGWGFEPPLYDAQTVGCITCGITTKYMCKCILNWREVSREQCSGGAWSATHLYLTVCHI